MSLRPSTQDLELAVAALLTLRRRGRVSWSTVDFRRLVRTAGRFRAEEMLSFLESSGLVDRADDGWRLSEQGDAVVQQLRTTIWSGFGAAVLRSGAYDDELARLLEAGAVADEQLRCPLTRLPRLAPVVGAILSWSPDHREGSDLVVPMAVLDEVLALSAMGQAAEIPDWVENQQRVGWRAELYSWRHELTRFGANQVLHTSRDMGDGFGYDIERTANEPSQYIEVKGSRSARVSFVITAKELDVARNNPDRYEIQFWGEVSLGRPVAEEYVALSARGYPIVVNEVAAQIDGGSWSVEAQSWRVRPRALELGA